MFPEVIPSKIASWRNTYCACEEEREGEGGEGRRERGEEEMEERMEKGREETVERGKKSRKKGEEGKR